MGKKNKKAKSNAKLPAVAGETRDDLLRAAIALAQRGSYDAARNGTEYANIWANADRYDADSANSKNVRHTLIANSRYEIGNNGYSDGIAQTYSTDLVGVGPTLRMQTGSQGLNQLVESKFRQWAKAIRLRSKLWTQAHAKHSDGEGIGVIRRNLGVKDPVKLDVQLIEAEQCQTPWLPYEERGYIDGLRFDDLGNPVYYEFLLDHPGSNTRVSPTSKTEKVPAEQVLHWFKCRRPGQHRGVPECASTLNVGAAARRWREATLAAAETVADMPVMMKTQQTPDDADPVAPFSTMDITKRMMAFLPSGWDPWQMKGEFPTATHEAFSKSLINEQARPKSMPYNKAACDSSSYNYASGRLDHQTYYGALDIERADCEEQVLDKLFDVWIVEAIAVYGWFGGNASALRDGGLSHSWDWPKHQVADVESEADANKTKLTSGQLSLHRLYSESGYDIEDEIPLMADTFGVDEAEIRKRLLEICLPAPLGQQTPKAPAGSPPSEDEIDAALKRALSARSKPLNGNGVNYAVH